MFLRQTNISLSQRSSKRLRLSPIEKAKKGKDLLYGGGGADTFVYGRGHGSDWIGDFGDGADVIDLSAFKGISGFEDLHVWALGTAAVVDLTDHGSGRIWLSETAVSDLGAEDFVFYEPPADGASIDGM